jgi:hypothetical protein
VFRQTITARNIRNDWMPTVSKAHIMENGPITQAIPMAPIDSVADRPPHGPVGEPEHQGRCDQRDK